jgi:hypothetical protein
MSDYLTEEQAAKHIGFSIYSLRKWRNNGTGPAYIQTEGRGGGVRYTISDLDKYMESRKVENTVPGK